MNDDFIRKHSKLILQRTNTAGIHTDPRDQSRRATETQWVLATKPKYGRYTIEPAPEAIRREGCPIYLVISEQLIALATARRTGAT